MKTIYIDVYFMINFTVDILAVFIAARITHVKINIKRLLLCGFLGALFAIIALFLKNNAAHIGTAILFIILLCWITCKNVSLIRKIKFLLSFYIASFLIGGLVNYVYELMDRYIGDKFTEATGTTNRKAIIFSLIILLIIGVLRLFVMMLSEAINEKSIRIRIDLGEKSLEVDALIDTGNLVRDPMNMNPVIFIKRSSAEKIIPSSIIDFDDIDSLGKDFKKRIRLIPVTRNSQTHVMMGVRVDRVIMIRNNFKEEINATIVIDKEDGTYGGFYALTPYISICNGT